MSIYLRPVLDELGLSLSDLARGSGMSRRAAQRLAAAGELPRRNPEAARQQVVAYLKSKGATPAACDVEALEALYRAERRHVALIAQPELAHTLAGMNAEIREVAQRCEMVWLAPLDNELEAYLRHKFARFDLKYEDVFEADAADAIRGRLVQRDRNRNTVNSTCYPLAVHNLVCRAMNVAAEVGWPKVDAQAVAGC